ncbi:MAG: hypothetical protein ACPGU9_06100 [Flavobacteriaceae bacterium]
MKFTNKKILPLFKVGYLLLLILIAMVVIYNYLILNTAILAIKEVIVLLVLYILSLTYWYRISKYIEFDSAGSGIVFITKGILLSDYINHREHRIELPKEKLVNYKIINRFFYKKVVLHIKSKKKIKKVSLDISFLSVNKTKALKLSLDKIVRENS